MNDRGKLLIIRFSAMGDVAMTAPVIKELSSAYPTQELLMLSRSAFKPFFSDISNLEFISFDSKGKHKGFLGLITLFYELKKQRICKVADLHNSLRSKVLCLLFFLIGVKTISIDKGRSKKKGLTRKHNKELIPLKPTVSRYGDVFSKLGFAFELKNHFTFFQKEKPLNERWIGVSPFAQHTQKVYPLGKMEKVLLQLADLGYKLFIFGGSIEEEIIANEWANKRQNITSLVKKMSLSEELEFISKLDLMVSMDSSGMHLASLKNIPVISIWGSTHPYAGFLGYGQSISDAVQLDLYCRPCSVYGNVKCYRGDFACMNNLAEQSVIDKVIDKLRHHETAIIN
jgi:ADP-heptose:LPS heptosyltransferase